MDNGGLINVVPIRKVYVTPIVPQFASRIERYFQGFGEVESIYMHTKGCYQFGFIQYKSTDVAKAVLSISKHRVANRTLTVKPAHDKHQPDYEKYIPPQQDSPRHILNALNDDCLERIFRQLDLVDLSAAADVCIRFQQNATDAFESKFKHEVNIDAASNFKDNHDKFEMMLRNFGSVIHALRIENHFLEAKPIDLLNMIDTYASALKELFLSGFRVSGNVHTVRSLFAKLEKITLFSCQFTNGAEKLLEPCAELKDLRLLCADLENSCIDQTFPKLEEVHLGLCSSINDADMEKFIVSNPTLKKFTIGYNFDLNSAKIIQSISQHLKNLEELYIGQNFYGDLNQKFESLSQLGALKKLSLNCHELSVTSLLSKLAEKSVPLEYLAFYEGSIDSNGIESMVKLKKLNEIKLVDIKNLTDDHVIELAKGLPQLNALHLSGSTAEDITVIGLRNMLDHAKMLSQLTLKCANNIQFIGMNDYRSMLKSVQERPKEIKLEIKISGDGDKLNVPEDVLLANRNWLWIDEEIENDEDNEDDEYNYDSDGDDDSYYDSDYYVDTDSDSDY